MNERFDGLRRKVRALGLDPRPVSLSRSKSGSAMVTLPLDTLGALLRDAEARRLHQSNLKENPHHAAD